MRMDNCGLFMLSEFVGVELMVLSTSVTVWRSNDVAPF